MSTLLFGFSRKPLGELSGFDLGDITVCGPDSCVSSEGRSPSQPMMIYLAVTDLLLGVSRLCEMRHSGSYTFVGADSSFTLSFSRSSKGEITVAGSKGVIGRADRSAFLAALREAVDRFLDAPGNRLSDADPVAEDLRSARSVLLAALIDGGSE